jgi:hypothetical protein
VVVQIRHCGSGGFDWVGRRSLSAGEEIFGSQRPALTPFVGEVLATDVRRVEVGLFTREVCEQARVGGPGDETIDKQP